MKKPAFSDLSDRQRDVLALVAAGLSNKAIADKLFISENTVKYHIKNVYIVLQIKDRRDLLLNVGKWGTYLPKSRLPGRVVCFFYAKNYPDG